MTILDKLLMRPTAQLLYPGIRKIISGECDKYFIPIPQRMTLGEDSAGGIVIRLAEKVSHIPQKILHDVLLEDKYDEFNEAVRKAFHEVIG